MQKFQPEPEIAAQIAQLNEAINTDGVTIVPKWRSIGHNGRAIEIPVYSLSVSGSGRLNGAAQSAKDAILPIINGQIAVAARQAIEQQIAAEETARQNEAAAFQAQLAEERRRAKETADIAAIAADEQRQKILKEAAEKEAVLQAQLQAIQDAKTCRYNKASRIMAAFSMVLLALVCIVGTAMNYHNVSVLYGQIFHPFIIALFAFVLAFIPIIFAWVRDDIKVEQSTVILPIDYAVTVLLFIFCNPLSPLVANWQWLAENAHWVLLTASVLGVGFYAYQTYLIYNKLLAIIASEKYKEFFMSLFD